MKILLVGSELSPLVKIGGLGDVMGALPRALQEIGVNIDVVIPFYPNTRVDNLEVYKSMELNIPFGGENYILGVYKTRLPMSSVDVFLLKNDHFFGRGGESAFENSNSETEMFMFFNRAVVELIKSQFNTYDLIHCNDWHTGLVTHLLKDELDMTRPATLFTVHNVMYQGLGDSESLELVGITPGEHPLIDWDIEDGDINMMLQGITSSDYVNAVSQTYAKELLTPEFGGGFSEVFSGRAGRLTGILNGIDYNTLPRNYDVHNALAGKIAAKIKLYERLKINIPKDIWLNQPLFSFIGRLDSAQKGLDLLEGMFLHFHKLEDKGSSQQNDHGANSPTFVLLGKGDFAWEEKFKKLNMPNVHINISFDEDLANLIYAGSDFLLVPSKYEPCGLIQMMAMWYGTLPIVRGVGGLKDTVKNSITGYVFNDYSVKALVDTVEKALNVYLDKAQLEMMIQNSMREDFSWKKSAEEYKKLYEKIIKSHRLSSELLA